VPISVVLVDDHHARRMSLRSLLESDSQVTVVAEGDTLRSAIRHVIGHTPHVLVLDLRVLEGTTFATIERLHAQVPQTKIVVVAIDQEPAFAQHALAAGATAYVLTDHAASDLPRAVRLAACGQQFVTPLCVTPHPPRLRARPPARR